MKFFAHPRIEFQSLGEIEPPTAPIVLIKLTERVSEKVPESKRAPFARIVYTPSMRLPDNMASSKRIVITAPFSGQTGKSQKLRT